MHLTEDDCHQFRSLQIDFDRHKLQRHEYVKQKHEADR